ncbi:MAG: GxxExxY protein [Mangrovibacterium sp.]
MLPHEELTDLILKSFYKVYNRLGYGFLEKVYENALLLELRTQGVECESQRPITVYYDEVPVGEYFADIIVEDMIILELKAAENICENHEYQLLNYLKATKIELGFLLNFGKHPGFKRKIYSNQRKFF